MANVDSSAARFRFTVYMRPSFGMAGPEDISHPAVQRTLNILETAIRSGYPDELADRQVFELRSLEMISGARMTFAAPARLSGRILGALMNRTDIELLPDVGPRAANLDRGGPLMQRRA